MTDVSLVELDAREFGQHVKLGGWRLGLLVARNVEKGKGNGGDRRSDQFPNRETENVGKVNALKFAELSGVGKNKVLRYLDAWNRAANDLPELHHSDELAPGNELDLDEEWIEIHPWGKYYTTANKKQDAEPQGTPPAPEQQEREFRQAVTSNPDFARKAAETLREVTPESYEITPDQVREAVRSNPEVEQAAKDEAFQRMRERAREQSSTYDPTVPHEDDRPRKQTAREHADDALTLLEHLRKSEKSMTEAMYAAQRVGNTWTRDESVTGRIRDLCDMIDNALLSGGMDAELAALLEGEK